MADTGSNPYQQAIGVALNDAKSMLGKNEVPDRAEIQSYLRDGGQDLDPHKLAWCAAFVSSSLQKAGLPVPTQVVKDSAFGPGAYAPNYLTYGSAVDPKNIQAGDILVNNNGSHVGFAEGPIRQGKNGPEVQLLAGNQRDPSGQYAPGSYTNPTTGAVANRAQVGMVGETWVPLSQYSARRYVPTDGQDASSASSSSSSSSAPTPGTTVTASTPFSLSPPGSSIPSAGQYQPLIDAAAKKYNLDPNYLSHLLWQENRFRPQGTSSAGAQGIAQFMPATAKRYGVDVNDPASSIDGAAHYLSDLSSRYNGNLGLAAAGYNWGEGNVDKWLQGKSHPPSETTNYVNTITGHSMDEWRADPRLPLGGSGGPGRSPSGPSPPATPGTTLSGVAAGALPGMPDKATSDLFTKGLEQVMGKSGGAGGQGGQDPSPQPSQMLGPPPMARNTSPLGGALLASPQSYGQTINSLNAPLQWGASPVGASPYAAPLPVGGRQAGAPQPVGAQAQPIGTSLNSIQNMDPQAYQDKLALLYGVQGGGSSYG